MIDSGEVSGTVSTSTKFSSVIKTHKAPNHTVFGQFHLELQEKHVETGCQVVPFVHCLVETLATSRQRKAHAAALGYNAMHPVYFDPIKGKSDLLLYFRAKQAHCL
jgi:hypothetical protein